MIAPDRNTDPGRVEWLPGINAGEYCGGKLFSGSSACLWFWIAEKFPATAEERIIHLPCIPYRAIHIQSRPTELLQPFGRACGLGDCRFYVNSSVCGYSMIWGVSSPAGSRGSLAFAELVD